MTSINTNASATTALRTLQLTNESLNTTQSRISTGLKIGEAKDNAAYWAISTTLKSDNKSLATVKDALGLGSATVDTAYQGLNKAKEVLDEIKSKLTSATQDGVDRAIIQSEIDELQKQLVSVASSSVFSGENWLSVDSSATGYNASKQIVSGFTRDASGAVSVGTIGVDTASIKLYDASSTATGILDGTTVLTDSAGTVLAYGGTASSGAAPSTQSLAATTATAGIVTAAATSAVATAGTIDLTGLKANDRLTFNLSVNGAVAAPVSLTLTTANIASNAALLTALNTAIGTAGVTGVTATANGSGQFTLTSTATGAGASVVVSNVAAVDGDGLGAGAAPIVQSTATGGLTGATTLATGTSTAARSTAITFAAVATAAAAGTTRLIEFNFQYEDEVYLVTFNEAAIAGSTTGTALATQLNTAIQAATRVGDGVVFSAAHPSSATVGFTIGNDPDDPTDTTKILIRSKDTGTDAKLGISNINSYAILTSTGARGAANAAGITYATDLGLAAFFVSGTDTAATLSAAGTFASGTTTAVGGDRITFDATLSTGPLTANQTTATVSVQTSAAWTAATFATSVQQAVDAAFGAGKVVVDNNAGTLRFTTVATGSSAAFGISNVVARDGDGVTSSVGGLTAATATGAAGTTAAAAYTQTNVGFAGTDTYDAEDTLKFNVAVDGGAATTVTINKATISAALGTTDGVISSGANFATVVNQALTNAGITTLTATNQTGNFLRLAKTTTGAGSVAVTSPVASTGGNKISVATIDLTSSAFTSLTATQKKAALSAYISVVNTAINAITSAAADLGSVSSRIDLQKTFVTGLIDTIDKGVGELIDADITEESTRLQALQVKQQLGVQALSIANQSSQNILRLFQ